MPRIPDAHLASVVFVYPSLDAARRGHQVGGSGFVVNTPTPNTRWRVRYVVTNRHVVDGGGHWIRLNRDGGTHVVHLGPENWHFPDAADDIAIAALPLPSGVAPYELSLDTLTRSP